tara:strand:+ start:570 stop:830 length:261 start_codon:yes stop_codon:yes gene_type:complete
MKKKVTISKSRLKEIIKEEYQNVLNEEKVNELTTDQRHKKAQKLIKILRATVKELADMGEDYAAFQNAKYAAKLLKKMRKDVLYIS